MHSKDERDDGAVETAAGEQHAGSPEELHERCADLAGQSDILACVERDLYRSGFAGASTNVLLVVLVCVTRLFDRPVSVALSGPSSAGKSFTIKAALAFHPPEAAYVLTGMSEKALMYLEESLAHRFIVLAELNGLSDGFLSYGLRSLLSEGRLQYLYTDFEHKRSALNTKEGPTGLITSTTDAVEHQLGTRLLTPTVAQDAALTRAILLQAADEEIREPVDFAPYHALQRLIATCPRDVSVPFGIQLADGIDPRQVRMRRDFHAVLSLVKAHALLHQLSRDRDEHGRVVATRADYAAVFELVADLLAEGAELEVPREAQETSDAVEALHERQAGSATIEALGEYLGLTRTAVTRRVNKALELGLVRDSGGGRRGRKRLLVPGEPMPGDGAVLPSPEILD